MNLQNVFERFILLSGLQRKEATEWLPLCSDSFEEIKSKLKDGVEPPEYLVYECASVLAYYKYCLALNTRTDKGTFSAGDIKITKSHSQDMVNSALCLYKQAVLQASEILKDSGCFVFETF